MTKSPVISGVMPVDLTKSNVDPNDPRFQPVLNELQANIIKGHGRNFAYHIFLQLDAAKADAAKNWIAGFAEKRITSALKFEQGRKAHKATGVDGGAVFTLSISATGYADLGFPDAKLPLEQFTPAIETVHDPAAFPAGAKAKKKGVNEPQRYAWEKLGDGDPATDWEVPFRGNVDVLIIVADDNAAKAHELSKIVVSEVALFSTVLLNQRANVLKSSAESGTGAFIEHFGFADGISQPLFMKDEIEAQRSTVYWNDGEPLNLVLVPDTNGRFHYSYGSFLVFRKLEQNVEAFMKSEEALSAKLKIKDSDGIVNKDLPGAMMVGRFRNGNTVVESGGFNGNPTGTQQLNNDFNYSNDNPPPVSSQHTYSSKCPYFAHTRITNPRNDIILLSPAFTHAVRLTRRAIPYQDVNRFGEANQDLIDVTDEQLKATRPSKGVGLLFMSYQAHIGKQFEFIQNNWSNHGHITGRNIGPDGIIGQIAPLPETGLPYKPATPDLLNKKLPGKWGEPVAETAPDITFGYYVKNLGGEYFFTPSISFLQNINKV